MSNILKSKKGLTLVEVVIGMLVLSLIILMAGSTLAPMMRFQRRTNELAEQNFLLDNLANHIVYDLSMTMEEPVLTTPPAITPGVGTLTIPVEDLSGGDIIYRIAANGIIMRQQSTDDAGEPINNPLLPPEFYRGLGAESLALVGENTGGGIIYRLTLRLTNDNTTFVRTYAIRPLALN